MEFNYIKCPYCGREYLPSEIYIPEYFFGKQFNIVRNDEQQIVGFNGKDMDLKETFTCENCENIFEIESQITFKTTKTVFENFDKDFEVKS